MDRDDLETLLGTDPLSVALACPHEYVGVDGTGRIACMKCGIETTITVLVREGLWLECEGNVVLHPGGRDLEEV